MLLTAKASDILHWVSAHAGQYADVVIAGRVFGGQYGESLQCTKSASFTGTDLRIEFDPSEVLTIKEAQGSHRYSGGTTMVDQRIKITGVSCGIVSGATRFHFQPLVQHLSLLVSGQSTQRLLFDWRLECLRSLNGLWRVWDTGENRAA